MLVGKLRTVYTHKSISPIGHREKPTSHSFLPFAFEDERVLINLNYLARERPDLSFI